jgi:hypothetical protein
MAAQEPTEQNLRVDSQTPVELPPTDGEPDEENFRPSGAFRFVLVLIIGYIIYYVLTYYEIVILRGGA